MAGDLYMKKGPPLRKIKIPTQWADANIIDIYAKLIIQLPKI